MRAKMLTRRALCIAGILATICVAGFGAEPERAKVTIPPAQSPAPSLRDQIIAPSVLVRAEKATGSGTAIHQLERKGRVLTYVLTAFHVVEENVKVDPDAWDSLLKKKKPQEQRFPVRVEVCLYDAEDVTLGIMGYDAEIAAYRVWDDLALLEMDTMTRPQGLAIAPLVSEPEGKEARLFDPLYLVGAATGEPPFHTAGSLAYKRKLIEGKNYWLTNAPGWFGVSGGTIFRRCGTICKVLGVPCRGKASGFAIVPHMLYFAPPERIHRWLREDCYDFVAGSGRTYEQCETEREAKRKAEETRK